MPLAHRLMKVQRQIGAVIARFEPSCAGVETVWFGQNVSAAFATGQARGAALVACAEHDLYVEEFSPNQIKLAVVGVGTADKAQVQYMVRQALSLSDAPRPDHAADALAAAICFATHEGFARAEGRFDHLVAQAEAREAAARDEAHGATRAKRAAGAHAAKETEEKVRA